MWVLEGWEGGRRVDVNGGGGCGGGRQDSHSGSSGGGGSRLREAQVEVNWGDGGSSLHGVFSHL